MLPIFSAPSASDPEPLRPEPTKSSAPGAHMLVPQATAKSAASPSRSSPAGSSSVVTTAAGPMAGTSALSAAALRWGASRRLSRATMEAFGLTSGIEVMPDLGRVEAVRFPYRRDERLVNTKYRSIAEKKFRMQESGELRFFNLDAVLRGDRKEVWIFEGEVDALSAFEAGLPQSKILSVPNGAPASASDDPAEQDRYRFVLAGLEEGLGAVEKFILATDNDGPGRALRQDLVNILGAARCWFIDWAPSVK